MVEYTAKDSDKIRKILSNKRSYQTPVVINDENNNKILLFFFREKFLKALWIFDKTSNKWSKEHISMNITAACLYENNIYVSSSNGKIYIKKTGS